MSEDNNRLRFAPTRWENLGKTTTRSSLSSQQGTQRPSGGSNLSNLVNQEVAQIDQKINFLKSLPNDQDGLRVTKQTGIQGTRDGQLRILGMNRDRLLAKAAGGQNESFLGDVGSAVSSGAANFDKAIGYATGNVGLQQQARRRQQISGAEMTDYGREAREKGPLGEDMSFGQRAYATALALAESTPELAATAVIASAIGAAAPVAGTAAIGAKILSSAPRLARFLTAGSGAAASTSAKLVGERAIAAVANMGLSGTQAGLVTGSDTTAQVLQQIDKDPEAFASSKLGKKLLNENGGDFEAAKIAAANEIGRVAAVNVGAVEALMTLPAAVFEARLLTGGTRRGIAKEAGSGLVTEGISEAPASANEQLVQNLSMKAVGSDVGVLDGVAKAAGEGFIVGGALGGGLGAGGSVVNRLTGNAVDDQPRPAEDEELAAALAARGEAAPPREGGNLIEDQNAVALRGMDNISAGGMNYTPAQILDIARNNESNPRIADIMSQPVSDVMKVQQVARILNQEEVARVEPEAVRRISEMFGGTNSVSNSKQMITDELAKISPAVIAESPTLSAIAQSLESTGKQFVSGLRNAVSNYQPTTPENQTFVARPFVTTQETADGNREIVSDGSVLMTQDQVSGEAQRLRETEQSFRMADARQGRYDKATSEGAQREDLRAGAPDPTPQFFLNPEYYGEDLGGIAATIVGAEGGKVNIQYEQQAQDGSVQTVSEQVDPYTLFARLVRETPRLSQDLAGDLRKPKAGVGTGMNPRRSVDRTQSRSVVPFQEDAPAPPEQQAQNAQVNPQIERAPNVEGNVEGPNEISGPPAQLPAPAQKALPAPAKEEASAPEAKEEALAPAQEETEAEAPTQDAGRKVEKHVENIEDKILDLDRSGIVRYASKVHKEGLIDDADLAEIKRMSKDKDMGAEDIGPELISQLNTKRGDGGKRYSGRRETVRAPRKKASDVVRDTPLSKDKTAETEQTEQTEDKPKPDIDYEAVIQDRLDKIATRGSQGKIVASRLRSLLKQNNYDVTQLYYAFQMGEVVSRVLPKSAKVDVLFVPSITASDPRAAAASGVDLGEEAAGSYAAYKISPNGFRGLITLSLSDNVTGASRENAAHEAFHVIQDMLRAYDPDAFNLMNASFRDDMRIDDLDPSILRKLKTLKTDGEGSVYDGLIASLGNTPLSRFEAQAVAFGALVDAKDRGVDMKGLKASFIRVVDFVSDMLRGFRNIFRINGVESVADIFEGYRTGKAQESMTEAAPLRDEDQQIQYSGRRYNPEKGIDSAIENLKEDIADVGGEVLDATSIDELISSDQIPVITVKDLIGKKIFGTISDRTAAAALYTGIDSSKTVAIPLLGGPNFPLRMSNIKELLAWANRGGAILTKKMNKVSEGANYMMVIMGSADMHKSNTTVNNSYFATLEAYARDGRISGDAADKLTTMIQSAKDADPRIKKYLEEFPSFSDVDALDKYIHRISFEARKRIMDILDSKAALELGAPSLKQVLDATREPSMAGHRWGDGVLVLELIGDGVVSLGENGTQAHPDFPLGIKGRVVGRFETPINYELLWQDFIAESKRKTKSRGKTPTAATARYDFQQSLPVVEVTKELADKIGDLSAPNIDSARQARLASDMAASNWRTSDQAKNKGGVSTQEFVDAINNSPAKSVLNEYTTKDVNADIKSDRMRVFQLGSDGQIFFALKKGDPQYAEDYGIEIPMISKDEVMVTAVINNEQGARGIAGPAVMLKAIEEGATVLDCFAVKTKKFPNGFLPALYEAFGFTKVAEVPFAPEYYSKQKLDDAVKYWQDSSSGYNPKTDGYPPLVIMKWTGTDEQRNGVLDRYLQSGIEGLLTGGARANVESFADEFGIANRNSSGEGGTTAVSERTGGAEGVGAGASVASRARAVVEEIAGLSDQQLENLGLTKEDRLNAQSKTAGVRFSGVRRPANLNIGGKATKPSIRPNAPKFKTGPAVLGVDPMAERFPRLVNFYEKLVNRTRSIKQLTKNIDDFYNDKTNIDRAEQLMGSRAAYTTQEFHLNELQPVLKEIGKQGLSINEVETYMHNRHAVERNAIIRERNDAFQDGGSGINDAAAKAYLAALSPAKRNRLEAVAKKLDAITSGTLQVLQDSGIESAETIRNLRNAYKFYVPLFREGVDGGHALGTRGASVEGSALKAAVGSSKPVNNILANIVTQREAAINRAEANRLGNTVFEAALDNKDQAFWMVIDPSTATLDQVRKQLAAMGMDPDLADDIFKSPTKRAYNKRTGNVDTIADTAFKRQPNVFATRVDGTDKFIVFNPDEKMATDIAAVLKNDDLPTLEGASAAFINNVGRITRLWSQLRTQYMPEFGPVNFTRDIWGVMVNLTSTPLDGEQFKIMAKAPLYAKKLVRVIRATDNGKPTPAGSQEVADLFDRFEKAGGRTAIRESFFKNLDRDPEKLEAELQKAVKQLAAGKTSAPKVVVDYVTAWNDALENATRLATFKIAIDKGMTDAQAAEIAKNITVNFNQKGQWTREINSLYGFANASIASTDRNIKTMLGKAGKKILIGGVGLGVIQGLALAAAGYDEDDIPEWVKDHAFIIPLGLFADTDKYIAIPMPYFYNMFPAIGRRMVEAARGQLSVGQFVGGTAKVMINSVNPIAYGSGFIEFVSPSVFDMFVQYAMNEDGLGRRIYNKDFNDLNPTTGMSRARGDTTVMYAMYSRAAEVINYVTGGDEYEVGGMSPTPEEIKFFVEQVLPPMQFLYRSTATLEKGSSGEQIEANDIAFVRRFYGEVGGKTAEGGKFYDNVKAVNELKNTVKLREENGQDTTEVFDENPKAELIDYVGSYYRDVSDLRRERRKMILEGAKPSETQKLDDEITALMTEFNNLAEEAEKK